MTWLRIDPLSESGMMLLAAAIILAALAALAFIDYRKWEIDPWISSAAALAALVLNQDSLVSALLGAAVGAGLAAFMVQMRPRQLGQGDIWLYGLCGLITGIEAFALFAAANSAILLALAACLARKRRRKLRRCSVPAALAACPAAAATLLVTL